MTFSKWLILFYAIAVLITVTLTGFVLSTNSPAVFYMSLGQLEGNDWGIHYADATVIRMAEEHGFPPWYQEGAVFFSRLSREAVLSDPLEYINKCAKNLARTLLYGVYIGEWRLYADNPFAWVVKKVLIIIFVPITLWLYLSLKHIRKSRAGKVMLVVVLLTLLGQAAGQQLTRHTNIFYLPLLALVLESKKKRYELELANYGSA
jgi:hypothetical protein